jgi:hypothetical protein
MTPVMAYTAFLETPNKNTTDQNEQIMIDLEVKTGKALQVNKTPAAKPN